MKRLSMPGLLGPLGPLALGLVLSVLVGGCNPSGGGGSLPVADAGAAAAAPTPPVVEPPASFPPRRPVASTSDASAPPKDPRSAEEIAQAACQAPGFISIAQTPDLWRCRDFTPKPKPKLFALGSSTPIIPTSWTVPNWFVNKTTGSDSNNCTTSGTACKTKQEIWVHRWGMVGSGSGNCPRFGQTTTLEQDASDTDNSDPLYFCAARDGADLVIQGGPVASTAATFTRVAQKNTNVGTNSLLIGSFSAGAPAAGVMVTNTTALQSSIAWVYSTAGGVNWHMSQPCAPVTVPTGSNTCAEVDTWNTNDTVTLSTPIAINLVSVNDVENNPNAGGTAQTWLANLIVFDPGPTVGLSRFTMTGRDIQLTQVDVKRFTILRGVAGFFNNAIFQSGVVATPAFLTDPGFFAGFISHPFIPSDFEAQASFQSDFIFGGTITFELGGYFESNVYLDKTVTVNGGTLLADTGVIIYGSGANTINMTGSSHFWNKTGGNFQTSFTAPGLVTGIQLNGSVNASCDSGADPGVIHNATTTPAHLDAACGAGTGLGSAGFKFAGASVANF